MLSEGRDESFRRRHSARLGTWIATFGPARREDFLDRRPGTPFLYALASTVLAIAAIHFAEPVLAPLAIAGILGVVLDGAVKRVERIGLGRVRIGRVVAVLVVALGISGAFVGTIWIVATQGSELAKNLPGYRSTLQSKVEAPIRALERTLGRLRGTAAPGEAEAPNPPTLLPNDAGLVGVVAGWAGSLASIIATAGVVVVLLIFLLIERDDLRDRVLRVAGRSDLRLTGSALGEASERVARYLRSLALLNCGHGLAVGAVLALLGVPGALLFGLTAALLRFVPYIGPIIAAFAPLALSAAVFDGWTMVLWVGVFLGALELVSNNFVEPLVYGTSVGLSPFAVILSAIFWAWLWGPVGLVLATPLTVCFVVMGRHVPGLETISILLGDSQALKAFERIYERLLARDLESASAAVAEQNLGKTPAATWDGTLIPALRLLERDRQARALASDDVAYVRDAFDAWIAELGDPPSAQDASAAPVLCAGAGSFADEIVSAGLARILVSHGLRAETLSAPPASQQGGADGAVLCLSALDASGISVRQVLRRWGAAVPRLQIVVGVWGAEPARVAELRAALGEHTGAELVTTLERAIDALGRRARFGPPSAFRAAG
jgi:predicted PurR-regulated permease PerM